MFDVAHARGLYVWLGEGWVYLNAQEQAQIPERVNTAATYSFRNAHLRTAVEATSGSHSQSQKSGAPIGDSYVASARRAVADLVGARANQVVLGPSRAALLRNLADCLSHRVGIGTEVVLARSNADSAIDPWVRSAHLYGATVKWAEADLASGALPAWQFTSLVSPSTAIVALPAAHALVGAVTDVEAISSSVHRISPRAWTIVDATDVLPYRHVEIQSWGADVVALDLAPLGGPELGALVFRDEAMFDRLRPPRRRGWSSSLSVSSSSLGVSAVQGHGRHAGAGLVEWDPPQAALCGSLAALVDHWAGLDDSATGTRRRRLQSTMPKIDTYLAALAAHLVYGLKDLGVYVIGFDDESSHVERVPRISFIIPGMSAEAAQVRLADNGVIVGVADSDSLFDAMGVTESGGALTVGLAPYNTAHDVDHLLRSVSVLR